MRLIDQQSPLNFWNVHNRTLLADNFVSLSQISSSLSRSFYFFWIFLSCCSPFLFSLFFFFFSFFFFFFYKHLLVLQLWSLFLSQWLQPLFKWGNRYSHIHSLKFWLVNSSWKDVLYKSSLAISACSGQIHYVLFIYCWMDQLAPKRN